MREFKDLKILMKGMEITARTNYERETQISIIQKPFGIPIELITKLKELFNEDKKMLGSYISKLKS